MPPVKETNHTKTEKENFRQLQSKADLSAMFNKQQFFNPYIYYFKLYNKFPHRHWYKDIDKNKLHKMFSEKFDLEETAIFETHIHSASEYQPLPGSSAYLLEPELMLFFPPWEYGNTNDVQVYYSDTVSKDLLEELLAMIKKCYKKNGLEKRDAYLLMEDDESRLFFRKIEITSPVFDLSLYFNDNLIPVNELLLNRLNMPDNNGLVIFYGRTGTGKTTYIRYLSTHISKQKLFIPPGLIRKMGSAELLDLLDQYHNSVLIIEDADSLLKKRLQDDDHIVANLLNLSDGILADVYHIQIICSFNSDISILDPGLLRKGRLIAKYFFNELSLEKTQRLCKKIGYATLPDREMALADIFHWGEKETPHQYLKGTIGFK